MKISLNIEKRHLVFFGLFLVLVLSGYVIATGFAQGKAFHEILFTDIIKGKSGGVVEIGDSLKIKGNLEIEGNYPGKEETIETTTINNPLYEETKPIEASTMTAEHFCSDETEYPRLSDYNSVPCAQGGEPFKYWSQANNMWLNGECLGNTGKISSIKCERDKSQIEIEIGVVNSEWEAKICPEGRNLIGLRSVYKQYYDENYLYLVCN